MKDYNKRREQIRRYVLDTSQVSEADAPAVLDRAAWGETVHLTQHFARTRQSDRALKHAIGATVGGVIFAAVSFSAAGALLPSLVAGACCLFAIGKLVDCVSKMDPKSKVNVQQRDFDEAYRRVMTDMFLLSQVRTISDTMGDITGDESYPKQDRLKFEQLKSGKVDLGLANISWFFRVASHKRMQQTLGHMDQKKAAHVHETTGELYEAMLPKALQSLASGLFRGKDNGYNNELERASDYLNSQIHVKWEETINAPRYDTYA